MAATFLPPVALTATTSLQDLGPAVPSGKVRRLDIRAANVGAADAFCDVYLLDPLTTNSGYRAKNYPVPYQAAGSAPDMEQGLVLPAGWKVQVRASAAAAVSFTMAIVEDDA